MNTDEEVYVALDRMLPEKIDRESARISVKAGEAECGITDLLEAASLNNALSADVIALAENEYPEGTYVRNMLGVYLSNQN